MSCPIAPRRLLRRQRISVGTALAVPLDNGYGFAVALSPTKLAFFDVQASSPVPPGELLDHTELFCLTVHKSAWTNCRWLKVAKVSVSSDLASHTLDEPTPEHAAVTWEAVEVEKRLQDHFALHSPMRA
jgi:hypothetical protein